MTHCFCVDLGSTRRCASKRVATYVSEMDTAGVGPNQTVLHEDYRLRDFGAGDLQW